MIHRGAESVKPDPPGSAPDSPLRVIQNICFGFDADAPWPAWPGGANDLPSLKDALIRVLKRYIREAKGDIGLFLSGGIDSSYIGALLMQLMGPGFQTYTFVFNAPSENRDDVRSAGLLSESWGVKNHIVAMDPRTVARFFDDPFYTQTADGQINTFQMALYAARAGGGLPALCLTGIGADELMGSSFWIRKFHKFQSLPVPNKGKRLLAALCRRLKKPRYEKYLNPPLLALSLRTLFPPHLLASLNHRADLEALTAAWLRFWSGLHPSDDMERFQRLLYRLDLYEIQMSAYRRFGERAGTKVKHPFLDPGVMGYWNRMPVRERWRSGAGKTILRKEARQVLPGRIIQRDKIGLTWPWDDMLANGLNSRVARALFDTPRLFEEIGFDREKLRMLWDAYKSRRPCPVGHLGWIRLALKSLSL